MNIPALPTDNLYKFIALTGLFLAFIPITFLIFESYQLDLETARLETKVDVTQSEVFTLEKRSDNQNISKQTALEIQNNLVDLKEKSNQIRIQLSDIRAREQIILRKYSLYKQLSISGIILSIFGLVTWYIYLQRPSDKLLQLQIQSLEQQIRDNNNSQKHSIRRMPRIRSRVRGGRRTRQSP